MILCVTRRLGRRGKELDRRVGVAELSRPSAPVQDPVRDVFLKELLASLISRAVIITIFMVLAQHHPTSQRALRI
jgi:hypothetical protein